MPGTAMTHVMVRSSANWGTANSRPSGKALPSANWQRAHHRARRTRWSEGLTHPRTLIEPREANTGQLMPGRLSGLRAGGGLGAGGSSHSKADDCLWTGIRLTVLQLHGSSTLVRRTTPVAHEARHLRGWKEIANHVGVSERTVKRWERTRGLPIQRVPGQSRDAVFARKDELSRWLLNTEDRPLGRAADDLGSVDDARQESVPGGLLPTISERAHRSWWASCAVCFVVLLTILAAGYAAWKRTGER